MKVLVPGGCGYIGAMLVPRLLTDGHHVTVLDAMWFGDGAIPKDNPNLRLIKGDIRNADHLKRACEGADAVIHLASLSNNDACNEDPLLANAVNVDAIADVLTMARIAGVDRFIYASSVAAYGSSATDAKETQSLAPSTRYSEAKKHCERYVRAANEESFATVIARPASVCGYSLRQRFDLTVNMMVHDAMRSGRITVNGGAQKRSHVHMHDMCRAYETLLEAPAGLVAGQAFNFVAENMSVMQTAEIVAEATGADIEVKPARDDRSYTVDGSKARAVLGFIPEKTVAHAVRDLKARFDSDDFGETHYFDNSSTDPAFMNRVPELA